MVAGPRNHLNLLLLRVAGSSVAHTDLAGEPGIFVGIWLPGAATKSVTAPARTKLLTPSSDPESNQLGCAVLPGHVVAPIRQMVKPPQKRALALADNKLAENAGWDEELLAQGLRPTSILRGHHQAAEPGTP